MVLRRLMPSGGRRLLEIGAGFGRLTDEYHAYEQVVLLDYSLSQLRDAQEHLGSPNRYLYVAADVYRLPFRPGAFDAATIIRVIHHIADVPSALRQARRVLTSGGTLVMEYANKRNLKAMVRYALGKQTWSPYDLDPVEFVELNFDFHPRYIREKLGEAGFDLRHSVPVSFFRLKALKNSVPTGLLAGLDGVIQRTGMHYSPSVFTASVAEQSSPNNLEAASIFACPECAADLTEMGNTLTCTSCGQRWAIRDGIYDFKAPLED
jgi:SAM-dependent methyltransferase